jgi:peptide-methionine (S)-S-oxide reductase
LWPWRHAGAAEVDMRKKDQRANHAIVAGVLAAVLLGGTGAMAQTGRQQAVLGGGCFWCLEAVFQRLKGVEQVESGYAGGDGPATYREVCSGETGHAEVVRVTFDPAVITYRDLLTVFFATHDPTTLNRQGADAGTQYRSVIFCRDAAQKAAAEAMIAELTRDRIFSDPIVTELAGDQPFHVAEDYHQDYYDNNRSQGYCQVVINPKLKKLREQFADKLKD